MKLEVVYLFASILDETEKNIPLLIFPDDIIILKFPNFF